LSNTRQRKEKNCLNCNAEVIGKYCHQCGQENREPKESIWEFLSHFLHDLTHFDGKFFGTVTTLIRKPGFLSAEYLRGRRARYLHPVRMYIFTSAIFFIIFFALFRVQKPVIDSGLKKIPNDSAIADILDRVDSLQDPDLDSLRNKFGKKRKSGKQVIFSNDSIVKPQNVPRIQIGLDNSDYSSKNEYDSVQRTLPSGEKDRWLKRNIIYRQIELTRRFKEDKGGLIKDLLDKFMHTFPYLLFVSLPLFAFYFKLLYIRRKQFYYIDHGVFLLHLYVFIFLLLLVFFGLGRLIYYLNWKFLVFAQVALIIYGLYYNYRAMRNFYEQRRAKTIFKFLIVQFLSLFSFFFLFLFFFILTVFRI